EADLGKVDDQSRWLRYERLVDGGFQCRDRGQIDVTTDREHRDPILVGERGRDRVLVRHAPSLSFHRRRRLPTSPLPRSNRALMSAQDSCTNTARVKLGGRMSESTTDFVRTATTHAAELVGEDLLPQLVHPLRQNRTPLRGKSAGP